MDSPSSRRDAREDSGSESSEVNRKRQKAEDGKVREVSGDDRKSPKSSPSRSRDKRRSSRRRRENDRRMGKREEKPAKSIDGWVVFVSGLHEECTEEGVKDIFSEYGFITNMRMDMDRRTGACKVMRAFCSFCAFACLL